MHLVIGRRNDDSDDGVALGIGSGMMGRCE